MAGHARVDGEAVTTVTRMLVAAPPPADPGLTDACGEDPGAVCEAVWESTGNDFLAGAADWFIGRPLSILIITVVAWIAARLVRRAVRKAVYRLVSADRDAAARALQRVGLPTTTTVDDPRRTARATSISTVVASTVTVAIWSIAGMLILGELGIDLAPLIAGAGIAGIAIGFGAQNLVKDCVSGLFMLIEDQYGIGDVVDLGVATGVVDRISLRTTVLRGDDGTVWHVPNGEIRRVGNRSKLWSVAMLDVVVAYDSDLATVKRVVQETATAVCESEDFAGDVLEAPELLGVESAGGAGLTVRLMVKTATGAAPRLQRALREAIKEGLDRAGVHVPAAQPDGT
jgi:moderate conductance mechanosensitive channel